MIRRFALLALAPALIAALPAPTTAPLADELSSSQRKKVVKALESYFEAQTEGESLLEPREELAELIADLDEKADRPFLAEVEQLQSILCEARDRETRVSGKGRIEEIEVVFGEIEFKAAVRAPKGYKGGKELYPLVIVVPDSDQSPEEALKFDWAQPDAIESAVFCAVAMPSDTSLWNGFGDGAPGGVFHVMPALARMLNEYSIDPDRVILAGRGLGVAAAAEVAALFPHPFAGVVGIAGDLADGQDPVNFLAISTLWVGGGANASAFEGAADGAPVRLEPNLEPDELWSWVIEQRRTAHPERVTFRPRDERARDAYWISALGIEIDNPETGLNASIDRGTNTIEIKAVGIGSVKLYLNDALVDLTRPVRVVLNGVEHEREFGRSLNIMLQRLTASNDPGRIYVAQAEFDIETAGE